MDPGRFHILLLSFVGQASMLELSGLLSALFRRGSLSKRIPDNTPSGASQRAAPDCSNLLLNGPLSAQFGLDTMTI